MAASKGSNAKKSGGSQKTGTKNRQSSARKGGTVKKQQESSVVFLDEILFLLAMAVSILLLLSNLHLCGSLGTRLYAFMHGTTGVLGYVFPFFFFGVMVFFISNRSNLTAMLRLWAAVVAFWLLCGVLQLFSKTVPEQTWELAVYFEAGQKGISGGLLGGVLNALLRPVLGVWGMAVVLVIGLILLTVLITGRSFFQPVKRRSKRIYSSARQDMYQRREQYDERRAQVRERKKIEKEQREQELENQMRTDRKMKGMVRDPILKETDEFGELPAGIPDPMTAVYPGEQFEQMQEPDLSAAGEEKILSLYPDRNGADDSGESAARHQAAEETADEEDWFSAISREMEPLFIRKDTRTLDELDAVEHPAWQTEGREQASDGGTGGLEYIELADPEPDGGTVLSGQTAAAGIKGQPEEKGYSSSAAQPELAEHVPESGGQPGEQQGEFSFKRSAAQVDTRTVSTASGKVIEVEVKPEDLVEEISQAAGFSAKLSGTSENTGSYASTGTGQISGSYASTGTGQISGSYASAGTGQISGGPNGAGTGRMTTGSGSLQTAAGQNAAVRNPAPPPVPSAPPREYRFPPVHLLTPVSGKAASANKNFELKETAIKLQQTLKSFGVGVSVTNISCGPAVTRFEVSPEQGVKVSKIVSLTDDIKLNLAAEDIRIEAPIPGKAAVGIEVPNKEKVTVFFRELIESEEFRRHPSKLAFAVGKDLAGKIIVTNLASMPHLLIAGATGSGKSVCINTLIMSLIYKAKPEEVKLIMVDPKVVELSVYNGIPHLLIPVVTDPKKAAGALNWAVAEMDNRYNKFAEYGVRDLAGYNEKVTKLGTGPNGDLLKPLPQIVIIVDELADLMMVAPGEVEDAICRLAQLARAAGLHLVLATQRPSVNVITGLIKANMPSRIAFAVSSGVDSRTILDMHGAEKLLGKGDMLFSPSGYPKPVRLQGAFVSDTEVSSVVQFLAENTDGPVYQSAVQMQLSAEQNGLPGSQGGASDLDAYFVRAGRFVIEKEKASSGMLQRAFKIGFNRAARIVDQLAAAGVVGDEEGTKARKILMTMEEFETYLAENQIE